MKNSEIRLKQTEWTDIEGVKRSNRRHETAQGREAGDPGQVGIKRIMAQRVNGLCVHAALRSEPGRRKRYLVERNNLRVLGWGCTVFQDAEKDVLIVDFDGGNGTIKDGVLRRKSRVGNPRATCVQIKVAALK